MGMDVVAYKQNRQWEEAPQYLRVRQMRVCNRHWGRGQCSEKDTRMNRERLLKERSVFQRHGGTCRVSEDWPVPEDLKHTPPVTVAGSCLVELMGQKSDASKWRRGIKGTVYRQWFCKLVCEAEERNRWNFEESVAYYLCAYLVLFLQYVFWELFWRM